MDELIPLVHVHYYLETWREKLQSPLQHHLVFSKAAKNYCFGVSWHKQVQQLTQHMVCFLLCSQLFVPWKRVFFEVVLSKNLKQPPMKPPVIPSVAGIPNNQCYIIWH